MTLPSYHFKLSFVSFQSHMKFVILSYNVTHIEHYRYDTTDQHTSTTREITSVCLIHTLLTSTSSKCLITISAASSSLPNRINILTRPATSAIIIALVGVVPVPVLVPVPVVLVVPLDKKGASSHWNIPNEGSVAKMDSIAIKRSLIKEEDNDSSLSIC